MEKHVKSFTAALLILICLPHLCVAQRSGKHKTAKQPDQSKPSTQAIVSVFEEGARPFPFAVKGMERFEIRNGILNISIAAQNNSMIQINNISLAHLKDTILGDNAFKIVFINELNRQTFTNVTNKSNSALIIGCKSTKKGSPVSLVLKGTVYKDEKWYTVDVILSGTLPEPQHTSTRQTN